MKKALFLGILSSFFFAFTFVLNRSMNLGGGYWIWSASLRYFFTLPILFGIVGLQKKWKPLLEEMKAAPVPWILWSTVGFGLFYAPLTWASEFGESWLVVSLWQITIAAGIFLNPLWGKKIPLKSLGAIMVILLGVVLMQWEHIISETNSGNALFCLFLMMIAAVSYPLGNRKMMSLCEDRLDTPQRVLGMTICSMPFWILLSCASLAKGQIPPSGQIFQSLLVAIFSGVLATLLFFQATNLMRDNPKGLSMVEGTIAGEIVFTLLLGVFVLKDSMPSPVQFWGIALILLGMTANTFVASKK